MFQADEKNIRYFQRLIPKVKNFNLLPYPTKQCLPLLLVPWPESNWNYLQKQLPVREKFVICCFSPRSSIRIYTRKPNERLLVIFTCSYKGERTRGPIVNSNFMSALSFQAFSRSKNRLPDAPGSWIPRRTESIYYVPTKTCRSMFVHSSSFTELPYPHLSSTNTNPPGRDDAE